VDKAHSYLGVAMSILVLCGLARAQQQAQPQPATDDSAGFESIFDGKTLNGWEGDPKYWRVEDGALVGEITPGNEIRVNTFIIWRGGVTKDFELKVEYRISPQGNSGINYRSEELTDPKLAMKGYQFDIDGEKRNTGTTRHTANNYEERGRTFMALRGQLTRATPDGKRMILSSLGDYNDLAKFIKNGDWNQVHIIAKGNVIVHMLNGHVMSILVDDDEKNRAMEGKLGVQVHQGPAMKVEYRNFMLKKL
jgi:hypothetical protein